MFFHIFQNFHVLLQVCRKLRPEQQMQGANGSLQTGQEQLSEPTGSHPLWPITCTGLQHLVHGSFLFLQLDGQHRAGTQLFMPWRPSTKNALWPMLGMALFGQISPYMALQALD